MSSAEFVSRRDVLRGAAGGAFLFCGATITACADPAPSSRPGRSPDPELSGLEKALSGRAAAYARGDEVGWVGSVRSESGLDEGPGAFAVMQALGVREVSYGAFRRAGQRLGAELSYRIEGVDRVAATGMTWWQLDDRLPRRVGEASFPWEEASAQVRRGADCLVVGGGSPALLSEAVARADGAVAQVHDLWSGERCRPVVLMPVAVAHYERWATQPGSGGQIPAVTVGAVREGRSVGADRVVVNPQMWGRLVAEGKSIVLAHEFTHLVLRRDLDGPRPLWLDEGFCEYIAYRRTSLPEEAVAADLARRVARHGPPDGLPEDKDFSGQARQEAYASAWLACRIVAETHGEEALCRWVRQARGRRAGSPGVVDSLRSVTGWRLPDLESAWRKRVSSLGGR
ncbi:hypothetical protein SAMN05421595_1470 [Austwickia chelonae]|uniref:Peptidase MA-like domain-containing protein n=1 Tax=Austwickia chelonae NBRC 105200 TaxID=1184607 RepID=K6W729_9MICO|nr:hypothetical protein [Austwickia chelonae]GAB77632.1 hypothetical protein AUCHE_05_05470 [Austwickia chelonae NBRC 105200]SEW14543.1 hypothetical protein SAMN05421595_1470 [Austwickia chelonae]